MTPFLARTGTARAGGLEMRDLTPWQWGRKVGDKMFCNYCGKELKLVERKGTDEWWQECPDCWETITSGDWE